MAYFRPTFTWVYIDDDRRQLIALMSRVLFPFMFLIFNVVYWPYYLFLAAP